MYGKPNKTEKRIIRAWADKTIDDAYNALYKSGWDNDLSVYSDGESWFQNLPKVHPLLIGALAGVPYFTAARLAASLKNCRYLLEDSTPVVTQGRDAHGVAQTIMLTELCHHVTFTSPVSITCHDSRGKLVWDVRLVYGGHPYCWFRTDTKGL